MSLEKKINEDIKAAMLARDKGTLEALRSIKSALLMAKTGKDSTSTGEIPEKVEMQLLQQQAKQRKESAEMYKQQGREDLAKDELFQLDIIERYLPRQMGDDELRTAVQSIIDETGAASVKEMGKVMGVASKKLAGKADNKRISEVVKALLT
ncbi:MAG: GatB/YqeY domain-containing protein [Bacteroidales bacterium]